MEVESRVQFQSLQESEVFSPCSIEHQDVFMYDDEKNRAIKEERCDSPTYLDISSCNKNIANFSQMKTEPDPHTLTSWTQKHPEHWTQNEILDWIYFVASEIDVDPSTIRGEGFQNITGPELCRMTLDDFMQSDPVNGKCFYEMFRNLHKDAFFYSPDAKDFMYCHPNYTDIKQEAQFSPCDPLEQSREADNIVTNLNGKELQVLLGEKWYDIDPYVTSDVHNLLDQVALQFSPDHSSSLSDEESVSDCSDLDQNIFQYHTPNGHNGQGRTSSLGSEPLSDDDMPQMTSYKPKESSPKKKTTIKRKLKPGEQGKPQNRGRKPGQISKGNHLWEFIRDLLKDPKFNPHLLRWEEKETGVFRFVQSEAVAQMWGRKKNNPGMTYEKLSRAMRFCRTAGYFAEVPKTGKFPKKLCFRFGPKAFGWSD